MGLRDSKIVLLKSHGVYLKDLAQMTVMDKENFNVICFGGCVSPENPKTIETAVRLAKDVKNETGVDFEATVEEIFTKTGGGGKNIMECAGECKPSIVSVKWDREKDDVGVEKNGKALLGTATLACKYGGIIKIITSGQPET